MDDLNVYKQLADENILFITDDITDTLASDICAVLLLKSCTAPKDIITIYINSSGGDIANVLMIYDCFKMIKNKVQVICSGSVSDEAVVILAAGSKGLRCATKNSFITVSQLNNHYSSMTDLTNAKINLDLSLDENKKLMSILAKSTKKTVGKVSKDFERAVSFTAQQALKYGLIDYVI
jgi:ATP-dependent Clp protease protease subunit